MASYYLNSIKFINGSMKNNTTSKIEFRADLVEYINEVNFEAAKKFLEGKFKEVGYCCVVDQRLYTIIYGQGRRIKSKIKKMNSSQKHHLRENTWHAFTPTKDFTLVSNEVFTL